MGHKAPSRGSIAPTPTQPSTPPERYWDTSICIGHILPGLDDGSPDPTTSMAMISGLIDLGFDTLCATPHQKDGQYLPALADIEIAFAETSAQVRARQPGIEMILAAENMWDSVFFERSRAGAIPSYGDSSAFLVEFRIHQLPTGLLAHIFEMRVRGQLPVIAHPERYQPLWKTPELVERLAEQCAMVVDLGAVAGCHGRKQAKVARKMLQKGLAHAVASDAHAPARCTHRRRGHGLDPQEVG